MKAKREGLQQEWVVYILSCSDGSFYTGITNNIEKRLIGHNRGTASKYTRSRRPVILLTTSAAMDKGEALSLEIKIKKMPKAEKVACLKNSCTKKIIVTACCRTQTSEKY
jgi:putative endonuclease